MHKSQQREIEQDRDKNLSLRILIVYYLDLNLIVSDLAPCQGFIKLCQSIKVKIWDKTCQDQSCRQLCSLQSWWWLYSFKVTTRPISLFWSWNFWHFIFYGDHFGPVQAQKLYISKQVLWFVWWDRGTTRIDQKPNSWTHNFVEVSGHNLESSQAWGFRKQCLQYKTVSNHFYPPYLPPSPE